MRSGLSAERHDEIAAELQHIRDRVLSLGVEVSNAYPKSGDLSKFGSYLHKSQDILDKARCYGEENLFHDVGSEAASITTYYRHGGSGRCGDECTYDPQCKEYSTYGIILGSGR